MPVTSILLYEHMALFLKYTHLTANDILVLYKVLWVVVFQKYVHLIGTAKVAFVLYEVLCVHTTQCFCCKSHAGYVNFLKYCLGVYTEEFVSVHYTLAVWETDQTIFSYKYVMHL